MIMSIPQWYCYALLKIVCFSGVFSVSGILNCEWCWSHCLHLFPTEKLRDRGAYFHTCVITWTHLRRVNMAKDYHRDSCDAVKDLRRILFSSG